MKITDVRMETYRWSCPIRTTEGRFIFGYDGLDVARVQTDEGITGIGLGWAVVGDGTIVRSIASELKHYALGRDPLYNEGIWADMWGSKDLGRRGISTRVISSIDIALWDIKGKAAGMPLYKVLGGYTDSVPAYISLGFRGDGPAQIGKFMEDAVSNGVRAIKMQIGGVPISEDVERVRAAREAIGPDVKLMLDASSAYRHHEAIIVAERLEKYDIFWLEEPVAVDDLRGYQMVARSTSIPIATGEGEYTRYGYRDLIEDRCAAILQPDAMIMGGITEWMKVAAMAQAYDLPISNHGPHNVHVHLLAAIPNGLIIEEYFTSGTQPIDGGMFIDPPAMKDGAIRPPDRPGLGIELNDDAIAPFRTG